MRPWSAALVASTLLTIASPAAAQVSSQVGILSCDLSAGIGLIFVQKQTMTCAFRPSGGAPVDRYTGSVVEYGIELGGVQRGHLAWAVVATTQGVPKGALAGTYAGVSAGVAVGPGVAASALIGGTGRAFSLQPVSIEGEIGANLAVGVRTLTLAPAP
jgi:hypothetical protein